jgi:hypothetical protein
VRELGRLVARHLKDCAKLILSGLFGPHDDFRKLHFADIYPSQFGALAPKGVLKQMILASCRIPTSSCRPTARRINDFNTDSEHAMHSIPGSGAVGAMQRPISFYGAEVVM